MTAPTGTDRFPDCELAAYLDGTAPEALRATIDAAIDSDDALLDRLAALDRFAAVAAPAFDLLLREAPAAALRRDYAGTVAATARDPAVTALRPRRQRRWVWRVATAGALAATFLLGVVAGRGEFDAYLQRFGLQAPSPEVAEIAVPPAATPAPAPTWLDAVADYARLFTAETFALAPADPTTTTAQLAAVSDRVNLDLGRVAETLPGLQLKRAELLDLGGKPLGQVAYLTDAGRPVLLCVLYRGVVDPKVGAPDFKTAEKRGLRIVSWSAPRHGLLVIGDVPAAELQSIAAVVAERLG